MDIKKDLGKTEKEYSKQELAKIAEQTGMVLPKNLGDKVMNSLLEKSGSGRLTFPNNYAVGNALAKGMIAMKRATGYDKASEDSKAEALLDMVVMGHYPGKHGYYICYGTKMTWFPKYTGKMFVVNRALGITITAQPVYAGDDFSYEIIDGVYSNIKHSQTLDTVDSKKIIGAYAIAKTNDDKKEFVRAEVMSIAQIKEAWSMSTNKKTKDQFEEEYARRTVYNRLTKWFAETTDIDSEILDVAIANENKHYDFDKNNVVEEFPKDVSSSKEDFEPKDVEDVNFNKETGEVKDGEEEEKNGEKRNTLFD
jgi:recombinational DNA repair protein RecT